MSVIDINTRKRYASKGRSGAAHLPRNEEGLSSSRIGSTDVVAGVPISGHLSSELRALTGAVRSSGVSVPRSRPEGGAISHVSAMLQKMRAASAEEHERKSGPKPTSSDFQSWHDQIERTKQAMIGDGVEAAGPQADPALAPLKETEAGPDAHGLWRNPDLLPFATTIPVGRSMQKDIAFRALDDYGAPGDMVGRKVKVSIQSVAFTCVISSDMLDMVSGGTPLSKIVGQAFASAIRNYGLVANCDVIDAAFDGGVLNIRYVGDAEKPILASAFCETVPAPGVSTAEGEGAASSCTPVPVAAAPIDGVFAEISRSCIAIRRRQFVNDNALDATLQEPAPSGSSGVTDYALAEGVSAKRNIIQQAAIAMLKKAQRPPEQGQ